jgi:hypothetical protein
MTSINTLGHCALSRACHWQKDTDDLFVTEKSTYDPPRDPVSPDELIVKLCQKSEELTPFNSNGKRKPLLHDDVQHSLLEVQKQLQSLDRGQADKGTLEQTNNALERNNNANTRAYHDLQLELAQSYARQRYERHVV